MVTGSARVIAPTGVEVDGRPLHGKRIVVATGAEPARPPIPGLDVAPILDYASVFERDELPARICVLGGGPIGLEFAQIFARLGIAVSVIEALDTVLDKSDGANKLYESAYGYAVFDNLKIAIGISGGGGSGVAVTKGSGARTYMKMGTGGVGLGLGGQKYQVVFLFETRAALDRFVKKGWQADVNANAAAGTRGANEAVSFNNGVAIFQLTYKGLMAQADISGTKYWKHKKLNR